MSRWTGIDIGYDKTQRDIKVKYSNIRCQHTRLDTDLLHESHEFLMVRFMIGNPESSSVKVLVLFCLLRNLMSQMADLYNSIYLTLGTLGPIPFIAVFVFLITIYGTI